MTTVVVDDTVAVQASSQTTNETEIVSRRRLKKSHDGCAQCKTRKIKCDETKPECFQCRKRKQPCPGYRKLTRWSSKHERFGRADEDISGPSLLRDWTSRETLEQPFIQSEALEWSTLADVSEPESWQTAPNEISLGDHIGESQLPWHIRDLPGGHQNATVPSVSGTVCAVHSYAPAPSSTRHQQTTSVGYRAEEETFNNSTLLLSPQRYQDSENVSIVPPPVHVPTMLIEYWFKRVCPALSAFDSSKNPYRMYAHKLWNNSASVYHSMLSMSAACLNEQLPHLSSINLAVRTRVEAQRSLQKDLRKLDSAVRNSLLESTVMSCFLLGSSASWTDDQDLGLEYFKTAQSVLERMSYNDKNNAPVERFAVRLFFQEALIYWEMLIRAAGVVDASQKDHFLYQPDGSDLYSPGRALGVTSDGSPQAVMPHPLTASATPALNLLARALSLTYSQRRLQQTGRFSSRADLDKAIESIQMAQTLERMLLQLKTPTAADICDTDDQSTPASHFVHLAEAHRLVALLQLYKTFPDLMHPHPSDLDAGSTGSLLALALLIVDTLSNIAPSSGVRCMLPILLIMVSDGLQFQSIPIQGSLPDMSDWFVSAQDVRVAKARSFILDRLHCFERCLPARPIAQALRLVRKVWAQLDSSGDAFWMEVMLDSALATFFC